MAVTASSPNDSCGRRCREAPPGLVLIGTPSPDADPARGLSAVLESLLLPGAHSLINIAITDPVVECSAGNAERLRGGLDGFVGDAENDTWRGCFGAWRLQCAAKTPTGFDTTVDNRGRKTSFAAHFIDRLSLPWPGFVDLVGPARLCDGADEGPAHPESFKHHAVGESVFLAPLFQAFGFAVEREHLAGSPVSCLFSRASPAAVSRFIVAFVVNAIQRLPCWRLSHVLKECREVSPAFADLDASSGIPRMGNAPLVHSGPALVSPRPSDLSAMAMFDSWYHLAWSIHRGYGSL